MPVSKIESFFTSSPSAEVSVSAFRSVIEDHLTFFLNHASTRVIEVSAHDAHVFSFDWIGLLNKLSIPAELHWITIRLNNGRSHTDLSESLRSLYVPDGAEFNKLVQLHYSGR